MTGRVTPADDAAFRPWLYRVIISVHRNRCARAFWRRLIPFGSHDTDDDDGRALDEQTYRSGDWTPENAAALRRARAARGIARPVGTEGGTDRLGVQTGIRQHLGQSLFDLAMPLRLGDAAVQGRREQRKPEPG